jgi:PKD repeat protein
MKKMILAFLIGCLSILTVQAQQFPVVVDGFIANVTAPIPVTIYQLDSIGSIVQTFTANTDGQGYVQTSFNLNNSGSFLFLVEFYNCQGQLTQQGYYMVPGTNLINFTGDFCHPNLSCYAYFYYGLTNTSPFDYQFVNQSSGSFGSATWTVNNVQVSTNTASTNFTFPGVGLYDVCLTISDTNCTSNYCEQIYVDTAANNGCNASFFAFPLGNSCFHFFDQSSYSGPTASYFFDFGDGNISTDFSPLHCYTQPGTYTVTYTVTSGTCTSTYTETITTSPNPYCDASFNISPDPNNASAYNFEATAAYYTSYTWDFGDGSTMQGFMPQAIHSYQQPGTYQVCLSVADSTCTNTYCYVLHHQLNQSCFAFFSAGLTYQNPLEVEFYNYSQSSTNNYTWTIDGAPFVNNNNTYFTYTFPSTGQFEICLNVNDTLCSAPSYCQWVHVDSFTSVNCFAYFSTQANNPTGTCYNFTDLSSGSNGIITSYYYDFGDGNFSTVPNPAHCYAAPGIYYATLTVSDGVCNSIWQEIMYVGYNNGYCDANFNILPDPAGQSNAIYVEAYNTTASTYTWDFGDGTIVTGTSSTTHAYTTLGMYLVSLTISDTTGCTNTYAYYIDFTGSSSSYNCFAYFYTTPSGTGQNCYDFLDLSFSANPNVQYFYDFGDGSTSNSPNPSHCYAMPGVYPVTLTINDGICTSTWVEYIYVGQLQPCAAYFLPFVDNSVGNTLVLINASYGANYNTAGISYFWDFGDGHTSTDMYPSHNFTTAGMYNICLTINDTINGCTSTYCDSIGLDTLGNLMMRGQTGFGLSVISPESTVTSTSTTASTPAEMIAFPNPIAADGLLNIQLKAFGDDEMTIQVINTAGVSCIREAVQGNADTFTHQLNLKALPAGMYIIQASSGKQLAQTRVVVP